MGLPGLGARISAGHLALAALLLAFCLISAASFSASAAVPGLAVAPLAAVLVAGAGVVLLLACAGSSASALCFLLVLVFVNDALFRTRDVGDVGLDWQNALKMALWGGAAVVGACRLAGQGAILARPLMIACLAYVGVALLSTLWSVTAIYSGATAFGMLGLLLFAVGTVRLLTERQILVASAVALTGFTLVGWVVYVAVPDLGQSPFLMPDGSLVMRICGIAGQANALGHVLVVLLGVLFLLWYRGHARLFWVAPPAVLGIVTLLAADSRSSLLGFMVAVAAVVARRTLWLWCCSMLAALCGTMVLLAVPLRLLTGMSSSMSRSGDPTELFTLTGRTEIWQFSWDKIVLSPWLGYGYNSSKVILPQFLGLGIMVDEAHNMLLQSLLSDGILGTIPLVALMLLLLVEYLRRPDPMRDFFFFVTLIGGITEASAFGATPALLTLFLFIGIARSLAPKPTQRLASTALHIGFAARALR